MENRQITRDDVFVSATEPILYDGCDFRLYWAGFFVCFMMGVCLFVIAPIPYSLYGIGAMVALFIGWRWLLREWAKDDPLLFPVYRRHLKWPASHPPVGKMLNKRKKNRLVKR